MNDDSTSWQERLYDSHAAELILYGRALGLSHCEAEDVLQDTFMALTRLDTFPEQPLHYTLRSYRNRALTFKRTLWRRLAREWESRRWFERDPQQTPRERAALACLAMLPPAQREIIVLKIWHRHTFETIGELLDISPHTAAGRYRYGMEKLRKELQSIPDYESMDLPRDPVVFLETASPLGPH